MASVGWALCVEVAGQAGLEFARVARQGGEVGHVDAPGGGVGGGEDDIGLAFGQRADRMHALVEDGQVVLVGVAVAHPVQDADQRLVLLPEHLRELDQRGARALAQGRDAEEERPAVLRFQVRGHLGLVDDGRQLVQVAEHGEPHAAERLARTSAVDAQRLVDGPHDVGAHHRHLVDDEELEAAHDAAVAAAADVVGADQARRKAEEGMDGLAADVDGGEAGGRHDHHLVGDEIAQARGAASTCRCRRAR